MGYNSCWTYSPGFELPWSAYQGPRPPRTLILPSLTLSTVSGSSWNSSCIDLVQPTRAAVRSTCSCPAISRRHPPPWPWSRLLWCQSRQGFLLLWQTQPRTICGGKGLFHLHFQVVTEGHRTQQSRDLEVELVQNGMRECHLWTCSP